MRTRFTHLFKFSEQVKKSGNKGGRSGGTWRLRIMPGQETLLYLTGTSDKEPVLFFQHYIPSAHTAEVCGTRVEATPEGLKESGDCVLCTAIDKGHVEFGARSLRCAYNVVEDRKYHKLGDKKYEDCTQTAKCPHCRAGNEALPSGRRKAEWSMPEARRLAEQIGYVEDRCASCFRGRIQVEAYECHQCGEEFEGGELDDDFDLHQVKCGGCGAVGQFEEFVYCNKCDDGKRARVFGGQVPIIVKRGEQGSKDGHSFKAEWPPQDDRPQWLDEDNMAPVDLKSEYIPRPAADLCKQYNIPNYLDGGKEEKQFERYSDDDPFAEEEAPARKAKSARRKPVRVQEDQDDDVPF
jgi:hypothetical protein